MKYRFLYIPEYANGTYWTLLEQNKDKTFTTIDGSMIDSQRGIQLILPSLKDWRKGWPEATAFEFHAKSVEEAKAHIFPFIL